MDAEPLESDLPVTLDAGSQSTAADDGRALHALLLTQDPTASSRIAAAFHYDVQRKLHAAYPAVHDPHLVDEAVDEAFMGYYAHPERYQPEKSALPAYLYMSARGDLLNLLERERRRAGREQAWSDAVAEADDGAEQEIEYAAADDVERAVFEQLSELPGLLERLFPDALDRQMLAMMMDGIRETDPYVALLAVGHLPREEQVHRVKKHKDRIKKKARRWVEQRSGGLHDE